MAANSLQAMLDRAKATDEAVEVQSPAPKRSRAKQPSPKRAKPVPEARTTRSDTRLIGGHFPPAIAQQLRILAAEEETTIQSLLAEALEDLFIKKGRMRVGKFQK